MFCPKNLVTSVDPWLQNVHLWTLGLRPCRLWTYSDMFGVITSNLRRGESEVLFELRKE